MEKIFVKKGAVWFGFMLLTLLVVLFSFNCLLENPGIRWELGRREFHQMLAETVLLFLLLFLVCKTAGTALTRGAGVFAVTGVFLWAHVVFVPAVISALYLIWICLLGRFLRGAVRYLTVKRLAKNGEPEGAERMIGDFLVGSCGVILLFCLMSAAGIGDIPKLNVFVCLTGGPLYLWAAWGAYRGRGRGVKKAGVYRYGWLKACAAAFLLTMLCIQAGRMNIAVDFDSRWYGLRSAYILNNGHGIYENMGAIGIVYSYSKGFEVLTLPLAPLPSYSFLLFANLWMCAGVLFAGYRIALFFMNRRYALFAAAVLSAIPGVMNMGITAKADVCTLLFQLIMIYYMLRYLRADRGKLQYLSYSTAAFLVTWTMKPTALVFSSAVYGMSILYILAVYIRAARGKKRCRDRLPSSALPSLISSLMPVLLAAGALAGIWARTYMLTGIPVTSVFSSIFLKLGYEMKYPYSVMEIPNSGEGLPAGERLYRFAARVYHILVKPVGEDMEHVILAWGGLMILFFLVVWAYHLFFSRNVGRTAKDGLDAYLNTLMYPFSVCCLVILSMLTQVDGNYFMLFYVLLILYGFRLVVRQKDRWVRRGIISLALPVLAFSVLVTCLTNWAFYLGFTPVSFAHHGYYDHYEAEHQRLVRDGNETIWEIVSSDPGNRLIAFGDHPGVLSFPCNVQSYEDITGVWGNVMLVKSMDSFVEFMDYAKTDYVYAQAGYMSTEKRDYGLVRDLIEYGKLTPVCYEEGNMLAVVSVDGEKSESSEWLLTEFDKCYITKDID